MEGWFSGSAKGFDLLWNKFNSNGRGSQKIKPSWRHFLIRQRTASLQAVFFPACFGLNSRNIFLNPPHQKSPPKIHQSFGAKPLYYISPFFLLVGVGFSWNLEISKHHFWIFWASTKKMAPGVWKKPFPSHHPIHRWNHPIGEAWYLCRGSVRQNRYCCMEPYCHGGWYRMQHRILGSYWGGDFGWEFGNVFFFLLRLGIFFLGSWGIFLLGDFFGRWEFWRENAGKIMWTFWKPGALHVPNSWQKAPSWFRMSPNFPEIGTVSSRFQEIRTCHRMERTTVLLIRLAKMAALKMSTCFEGSFTLPDLAARTSLSSSSFPCDWDRSHKFSADWAE